MTDESEYLEGIWKADLRKFSTIPRYWAGGDYGSNLNSF
jgi:hypothetical protein